MYVSKERDSNGCGGRCDLDCDFGTIDREVVKMENEKGVKLIEVTEPQIFDPPKEMLVWDFETSPSNAIVKKKVLAIFPKKKEYRKHEIKPILATDGTKWNFCAKVPVPRMATNRELSKWLAQGNGEWCSCIGDGFKASIEWWYGQGNSETKVNNVLVRKWSDTEWHKPDVEYLGIEEYK